MTLPANLTTEQQAARQEKLALDYVKAMNPALKLASLQHQRKLGPEELVFWAKAMIKHGVTPENFEKAMEHHLATSRFFPQPVEIAELVNGENSGNRAMQALKELHRQVVGIGPYHDPLIEDPVLLQTIDDFGGWKEINNRVDDSDFFRNAFLAAYRNNQKSIPVIGLSNQLSVTYDEDQTQMVLLSSPGQ